MGVLTFISHINIILSKGTKCLITKKKRDDYNSVEFKISENNDVDKHVRHMINIVQYINAE